METGFDFLQLLEPDMALKILMCLDDPAHLVRASSVSKFWRRFVITNGLSKQLCLKRFPQLSSIDHISNPNCQSSGIGSADSVEWEIREAEHDGHASLLQILNTSIQSPTDCIARAVSASSTDRYPDESIINTLNPRDRYRNSASYWSSKGQRDPAVPETLVYRLRANLCVVTEITIRPFEAYFQPGKPIYSAKFVRFRIGHPKSPREMERVLQNLPLQQPADDMFIWTYTSQDFRMAQENCLQHFKLPEPVLCIGGFLQIELFDRVQRQEIDGLFYICLAHVQVVGHPLSPEFDIEILEPSGKFLLKYYPEAINRTLKSGYRDKDGEDIHGMTRGVMERYDMLQYLLAEYQPVVLDFVWNDVGDDQ